MDNGFKYVEDNDLELESAYPYEGARGSCQATARGGQVGVTSYTDVPTNSPSDLQAAVAQQPVSVAIEADKLVF